jgi:hypothetical protein
VTHAPPEDGWTLARASAGSGVAAQASVASAPPIASTASGSPSAVEGALFFLLGGALLALVFASIPARRLATVSTRLVEHRSDIGLGMAASVALGAALLVVLGGT